MNHEHRRSGQVTSVDVARAAGVSQTAVSLVLSGRAAGRVSARTQEHIERTAAQLGYRPNTWARVLRGGLPQVIGLAVPDVRNGYFGSVFLGAERAARRSGMAVLLIDTAYDPDWISRLVEMNRTKLFAGAIVYAEASDVAGTLAEAIDHLVFVESPDSHDKPAIDIDLADGMRQVADHLSELGHSRIGHARADYPRDTFALRACHLAAALSERGCNLDPEWHYSSRFDLDESTRRAYTFLESTDVTAIFCDDDLLAAGVYRACAQLGRTIPASLSVVGFNDTDLTRYLAPELTSVMIPASQLGESAALALIDHMNGAAVTPATLPLTLTIRASTAPANGHCKSEEAVPHG
ncbi:LacI family transcriptional regulator [Saccharopolyspora sp. K220]|nr:LacI family transcriptional regulator [Saccharopolyspora soli]